jgi:hypothetical protein
MPIGIGLVTLEPIGIQLFSGLFVLKNYLIKLSDNSFHFMNPHGQKLINQKSIEAPGNKNPCMSCGEVLDATY